jgi:hypothetical protein
MNASEVTATWLQFVFHLFSLSTRGAKRGKHALSARTKQMRWRMKGNIEESWALEDIWCWRQWKSFISENIEALTKLMPSKCLLLGLLAKQEDYFEVRIDIVVWSSFKIWGYDCEIVIIELKLRVLLLFSLESMNLRLCWEIEHTFEVI